MVNILSSYEHYKKKWENTKKIRGRAEVIKPIGQRRRTWETIEKRYMRCDGGTEQEVYACHLYQTDVVSYYPDGSIAFKAEQWSTPLSAEFMSMHSPFNCYKKHGKLWVQVYGKTAEDTKHYPVPREGELVLYPEVVGSQVVYAPKETITVKKSVVDRVKAKDARLKLKGFLDWAKTFNKLSDGWVHNDTREQFGTYKVEWWRATWDYGLPKDMMMGYWGRTEANAPTAYEFLQTCDDDGYMRMYLAMFDGNNCHDRKLAKVVQGTDEEGKPTNQQIKLLDLQYKWEYVQRKIYDIADKAVDVRKEIEVEAGSKAMTKVVG
jgi:hypothetical protein